MVKGDKAMAAVSIRTAVDSDVPAIQSLYRQLDRYHADLLPHVFQPVAGDARADQMLQQAVADLNADYLIAEREGQVVGFLSLRVAQTPNYPVFRPRRFVFIEDAVVDESHRGAGVGKALFNAAVDWAKGRGATSIQTSVWEANAVAKEFYEAQGLRPALVRMELDVEGRP